MFTTKEILAVVALVLILYVLVRAIRKRGD
jgi:hypothetical protein